MVSAALLLLAAVQLAMLAAVPRGPRAPAGASPSPLAAPSAPLPALLLVAVGAGLAYDSAIFGAGAFVGEGDPLHRLSVPRYVGHAFLTPLLVVWAATLVRRRAWAVVLAAVLVAWGLVVELASLSLEPETYAGTLRYVHAEPGGPPIPAIVVIVVLFGVGVAVWRRDRAPWLALGSLVMFAASAVAFQMPPLGNLGEAVLFAAIVWTARTAGNGEAPRAGHAGLRRSGRAGSG
ncbi:hypothetical protein [Spirillospora sp. NPDC047279]|uniref:hypothetical protein n=1 Tax=Spirillospora sp. NPDC047279 TaxID=3155478 RepID=UPI0033FAAA72